MIAARDNEPGDTRLKLAGFNGDQMTSDPDYEQPLVKELELVLVVFDILYCRGQVQSGPQANSIFSAERGQSGVADQADAAEAKPFHLRILRKSQFCSFTRQASCLAVC